MIVINYSYFRQNLRGYLDKAVSGKEPVLITSKNSEPAVLISLETYEKLSEGQNESRGIEDVL